ncbi:MAG TPA: hypothetical protein VE218_02875 [Acidobacteriaceae bacterium]|nr:hypothetical protein [Acidobacteriaceae bacterium]
MIRMKLWPPANIAAILWRGVSAKFHARNGLSPAALNRGPIESASTPEFTVQTILIAI